MINWFAFILGAISGTTLSCLVAALCMTRRRTAADTDAEPPRH